MEGRLIGLGDDRIASNLDKCWIWRNVFVAEAEAERVGVPAFNAMVESRAALRNRTYRETGMRIEVPASDLPTLINDIHSALLRVTGGDGYMPGDAPRPAVPPKRSVTNEYIVCLEDGKKFKSLKRHLRTQYDISPEEYREKWGLPPDYPMVAPAYAKARSMLAKQMGLGQQRRGGK